MTCLTCPPALVRAGFHLSRAQAEDEPALRALYARHRHGEFAPLGLPEVQLHGLLDGQFSLQVQTYARTYTGFETYVLRHGAEPIGRLMLGETEGVLRLLDILLAPEWRGRGIGRALLAGLLMQAGREVRLNVAHGNPARRLYDRLGFHVADYGDASVAMVWSAPAS